MKPLHESEKYLKERLLDYYAQVLNQKMNVMDFNLSLLANGNQSEVYLIQFPLGNVVPNQVQLILKKFHEEFSDLAKKEFYILHKLNQLGFPVPKVWLMESDNEFLGDFIIMERVQGQTLNQVNFNSYDWHRFIKKYLKTLADLHQFDTKFFDHETYFKKYDNTYDCVDSIITETRYYYNLTKREELLGIFEWLDTHKLNIIPCNKLSLIHGDLNFGNIFIHDGELHLIDWTFSKIGDCRMDLARSIVNNFEWRDVFIQKYQQYIGFKIESIEFFEVMEIARLIFWYISNRDSLRTEEKLNFQNYSKKIFPYLVEKTGLILRELEQTVFS